MTHRGPFQPLLFCDSVISVEGRPVGLGTASPQFRTGSCRCRGASLAKPSVWNPDLLKRSPAC